MLTTIITAITSAIIGGLIAYSLKKYGDWRAIEYKLREDLLINVYNPIYRIYSASRAKNPKQALSHKDYSEVQKILFSYAHYVPDDLLEIVNEEFRLRKNIAKRASINFNESSDLMYDEEGAIRDRILEERENIISLLNNKRKWYI